MKRRLSLALILTLIACDQSDDSNNRGTVSKPYPLYVGYSTKSDIRRHGHNYYTFTPSSTGFHEIRLSALKSNLDWLLFRQNDFTDLLTDCDFSSGTADEACSVVLAGSTLYYLEIVEKDSAKGTFIVSINED